jgi:Mg2+ and Co2+ transporter CorA
VRDYHRSTLASARNEVTKRLTAIASLLLLPTFIVVELPELHRHVGYAYASGVIVATTLVQLCVYTRKGWV